MHTKTCGARHAACDKMIIVHTTFAMRMRCTHDIRDGHAMCCKRRIACDCKWSRIKFENSVSHLRAWKHVTWYVIFFNMLHSRVSTCCNVLKTQVGCVVYAYDIIIYYCAHDIRDAHAMCCKRRIGSDTTLESAWGTNIRTSNKICVWDLQMTFSKLHQKYSHYSPNTNSRE